MPEHDFAQDLFCGARLAELGKLDQEMELLEQDLADRREAGLVEYCFSLALPLEPQINKARRSLIKQQEELFGKVSTPRPSREMWSLYPRVLDARDCGASWSLIGETLWPKDDERCDLKHKARRTHEQAAQVRDNFPI